MMALRRQFQVATLVSTAAALAWAVSRRRRRRREEEVVGALDIGSMEHKLVVARVDRKARTVEVLHSEVRTVALGLDLKRPGGDGSLSESIVAQSRTATAALRQRASLEGAARTVGVATAVFRRATNGDAALSEGVKLIDQQQEGRLGYFTAVACWRRRRKHTPSVVSWDSGGASFQIASADRVYEGPIGNADAFAARDHPGDLVDFLRTQLPPRPPWLRDALSDSSTVVVAFGGPTSLFRLAADVAGTPDLSVQDVATALDRVRRQTPNLLAGFLRRSALTHAAKVAPFDAFIDAPYPELHLVLPKLSLLLAVMAHLHIPAIHYEQANGSCLGIFLYDDLWVGVAP